MINKLLTPFAAASLLMFVACSTSKLAQTDNNDDVYYSVAQAKEAEVVTVVQQEKKYVTESEIYADEESGARYYDDYSVRINRFYRYTPWRNYYDTYSYNDPYYSYNPYTYNRFNNRDLRMNVYIGHGYGYVYRPYDIYSGYYAPRYNNNYWGLQSYYNTSPYYGNNYGSGSYYGGMGRDVQSSPDYRPRPVRGFDNIPNGQGTTTNPGTAGRDASGTLTTPRSRAQRYGDDNSVTAPSSGTSNRPAEKSSRPTRTDEPRPARTSSMPTERTDQSRGNTESRPTRAETYTPPPSNSGSSSSSGRDNDGSSSPARPNRGN
ncbi:MAG TPA: hypothetical protein VNI52_13380 [Sphingobacteriaceae bacterium]|nr:hypothetical protein [Sphingobacteriaceae bacterium]